MTTITTTRKVRYHGWTLDKGVTLEAQPATTGGWVVAHPRIPGAGVNVPESAAKAVGP